MALLPYYFYDINATLPDGRTRWYDEFHSGGGKIVVPADFQAKIRAQRGRRNAMYSAWLAALSFTDEQGVTHQLISPKRMIWQAIRILNFKHSESTSRDWWENYQDAVFRVFVNPETIYNGREHKQWYVLCPEDCELVNRMELERKGTILPPRDRWNEKWLSNNPDLRTCRIVPVECCHHLRNETTGGLLPSGL